MQEDDDDRRRGERRSIDTWAEIEKLITREAEKKLAAEMLDEKLAADRAREFAVSIVNQICAMLPGERIYVPQMPTHHREARDAQIRMNFDGVCRDTAREVGLSIRQVRNIVNMKKN